jgi:Ca2+-transporting ATPase
VDQFTDLVRGLSAAEAAQRLRRDGPNALPDPERRGLARIVLEVLREPMFALLLAGGAIYLAIGEPRESVVLLLFASLSVAIAVVQGLRSERVLDALRDLTIPHASVLRDGDRIRVSSADLVRGDVLYVAEGERVPADAILRSGQEIEADESLLTGESAPVSKTAADTAPPAARPGGDGTPFLYSGALVVRGEGLAEVSATGSRTEIGRIGHALGRVTNPPTALARETGRIVRVVGLAAIATCLAVVLLHGLLRGAWLKGLLGGVALGMAMLPEEFPLILSVFMVMGAWRISQAKVLTRRGAAIEALGSATVLCTDKTGTLTQNRMAVVRAWTPDALQAWAAGAPMPASVQSLIEAGVLASSSHPVDPMERAFHEAAGADCAAPEGWTMLRRYGVAPGRLAVTHVWEDPDTGHRPVYIKGAAETVAGLCRLDEPALSGIMRTATAMAEDGLRVLGVAVGEAQAGALTGRPPEIPCRFLGLVGLADPVRPDVPEAVAQCRSAGVRVVMITGDYPATAQAIARQAGLGDGEIMTGDELASLSDGDLAGRIQAIGVFARILPEQKLRIVQALQAAGEVVAMTGDGVNDASALKAADIGIAMGERGTDVAREAASLVLLNDDFGSIVTAMRLGRRIYDNLQKAMSFVLAVHVPIAGLALFPLAAGMPLMLAPAHIALLEMIIDPVCSVVFEAETEEQDVMRRPPRPRSRSLFGRAGLWVSIAQGAVVLAAVGGLYVWTQSSGHATAARTVSFLALAMAFVGLAQVNRRFGDGIRSLISVNRAFVAVIVILTAVLGVALAWPLARDLLEFAPVTLAEFEVALGVAAMALVGVFAIKQAGRRFEPDPAP